MYAISISISPNFMFQMVPQNRICFLRLLNRSASFTNASPIFSCIILYINDANKMLYQRFWKCKELRIEKWRHFHSMEGHIFHLLSNIAIEIQSRRDFRRTQHSYCREEIQKHLLKKTACEVIIGSGILMGGHCCN